VTVYDDLYDQIKKSDFISINCQLTGKSGYEVLKLSDCPIIHYDNFAKVISDLGLLQIGMSVWTQYMPAETEISAGKKIEPKLKVTTYNFIINPFNTPKENPRTIKFENSVM